MLSCIAAILAWNGAATAHDVGFDMANIGNPNNPADPATGLGRVERTFAISKRSVTIAECVTFLNAVAKKDRHGLYNPLMASDPMIAGIRRDGPPGNDVYSAIEPSGAVQFAAATAGGRPVTYVNWFDVARFANWMSNGQPVGPQGPTTTEDGAYRLDGAVSGTAVPRNQVNPNVGGAPTFYLPTENQRYKAAYYSPTLDNGKGGYDRYATASDTAPSNRVGGEANMANFIDDSSGTYVHSGRFKNSCGLRPASGGDLACGDGTGRDKDCRGGVSRGSVYAADVRFRAAPF